MSEQRFWEPGSPPALDGLKDWCSEQVEIAVYEAIEEGSVWLRIENGELEIDFVSQFEVKDEAGKIDCIHKSRPFSEAIDEMIDEYGLEFEPVEKALVSALDRLRKREK